MGTGDIMLGQGVPCYGLASHPGSRIPSRLMLSKPGLKLREYGPLGSRLYFISEIIRDSNVVLGIMCVCYFF